jgi:hypothetical protein
MNSENDISLSEPFLKYRTNYISENNSGITTEIINFNKKEEFNKVIGTNIFVPLTEKIGSCCYCNLEGERKCDDYANKNFCINTLLGNWSTIPCYQRYNTSDCDPGGACCVNGRCVGSTEEKCLQMGGLFIVNRNCSGVECPDRCDLNLGCCCYQGNSYPLTRQLCLEIEGARFFQTSCANANCCAVGTVGACCIRKICYDNYTATECSNAKGIFQGPGSECISQFLNCCTEPQV